MLQIFRFDALRRILMPAPACRAVPHMACAAPMPQLLRAGCSGAPRESAACLYSAVPCCCHARVILMMMLSEQLLRLRHAAARVQKYGMPPAYAILQKRASDA